MSHCELAKECCVCNVPFCPYDIEDGQDGPDEWDAEEEERLMGEEDGI